MKKPVTRKSKRGTAAKTVAPKPAAGLNFKSLVDAIRHVHAESAAAVNRTVNTTLTLRNWVIGAYIHHYELNGADRAKYGEGLLDALAESLEKTDVSNCNRHQLYRYLRFFRLYPQIVGTLSPQFKMLPETAKDRLLETSLEKAGTLSPQLGAPAESLVHGLSYSHIEQIVDLEEPLKRAFYEIECIRGNWSVRDLKRQIGSLYFERSGLSKDKEKLSKMVNAGVETAEPKLAIRDPYIFEFLGLRAKDAVAESDMEAALIEHLREFLLELGHGFCLEAQQKSIVIG